MTTSPTPDPAQTTIPSIIPPREASLETLLQLYTQLKEAEAAVETTEQLLKTKTDRFDDLGKRLLPAIMADLGLTEIRMADGRILSIKSEYFGSVAQERMPAAVAWLTEHQMAGIVDRQIIVPDPGPDYLRNIQQLGINASLKQTIHSSRLKAFVRERLESPDRDQFPKELFAASVVNRAVLSDRA